MKATSRFLAALVLTAQLALAQGGVEFQASDTVATLLKRQVGKRVELRLKSAEKIGGKVEAIGDKAVHLSGVTGQELFDAVVVLDDISAVLVRAGK